jgi:glycosyltransferase involved in cell wall biosynthesis
VKEQFNIILRKIQNELKPSGFRQSEKITFFRIVSFIFSKRGMQRIGRIMLKLTKALIRLITGQKAMAPPYQKWLKKYSRKKRTNEQLLQEIAQWEHKPLISIVIPVYNPKLKHLEDAINSVKAQVYPKWELCISDDCSNAEVKDFLKKEKTNCPGIHLHFKTENGNISKNMNSAASLANGEYIAFLDQDDLLAKDALFFIAKSIIEKTPDIIYSDEDKINEKGERFEPFFKPSWSPHSLLSRNYINHFLCINKVLFNSLGGFNSVFDGAQDHDLLLRASDHTNKIIHVPEVLYHWRTHPDSTSENPDAKTWAFKAGEKAVKAAVERKGFEANVNVLNDIPGNYEIDIKITGNPKVSIIIPTKDKPEVLRVCLESLFAKTLWTNFELIVVDNNSIEEETFTLFQEFQKKYPSNFRVEKYTHEFNFSAIMNFGAEKSTGEYLLLLNNDTKIINGDWIDKMLSFAQLPNAGAIGAKLFFPNNKLQHVGVVLGIRGIVGHVYVGSDGDNPGYFQSNKVITNYSAVTAACLMIKKNKYDSVDGFDENLAIEYNDVDFCLKLYSKGLYNVFLPDVKLIHYESLTRGHPSSSRAGNERHLKEADYFTSKWKELIADDPFYNINLSRQYTEFQYDV